MALHPEDLYPGKVNPATPAFPFGGARDVTVPGDGTGTPWTAAILNDIFGLQQALLTAAGLTPSGNPDEVGASQYLDALLFLAGSVFASVDALKNRSVPLADGQVVSTPRTKWRITSQPTYTLPYANRSRVFDALDIGDGKYASPVGPTVFAEDFLDDAVTASNDDAVGEIAKIMRDGLRLDFGGKMFRVYGGTAGIPSGAADPVADRAQPLDQMLALVDLEGISLGGGGLYAADQSVAGVKSYFPSTLYLKQCRGVTFEKGSRFEAKGEGWGDSDASVSLSPADRQDFVGQNGGHAVALVRCNGVTGQIEARLCGSAAVIYAPSSAEVKLTDSFANAASLGYSAYNADSWCGGTATTGFGQHNSVLTNFTSHAEELTRREDGASVGSSEYASKGSITAEDPDVHVTLHGGVLKDAYPNGADPDLGAALLCTSSEIVAYGVRMHNVAGVARTGHSSNSAARVRTYSCVADEVRTYVHCNALGSFGSTDVKHFGLSATLSETNPVTWPAVDEVSATTVVANRKVTSDIDVLLSGCEIRGFSRLARNSRACYGTLEVKGGDYELDDYMCLSAGWAGSAVGQKAGIRMNSGARFLIKNQVLTDEINSLTNQDGLGVTTQAFALVDDSVRVESAAFRRAFRYVLAVPAATDGVAITPKQEGCYELGVLPLANVSPSVRVVSKDGVSGADNYLLTVAYPDGYPAPPSAAIVRDDLVLARLVSTNTAVTVVGGEIRQQWYVSSGTGTGTAVGAQLTVGDTYQMIKTFR